MPPSRGVVHDHPFLAGLVVQIRETDRADLLHLQASFCAEREIFLISTRLSLGQRESQMHRLNLGRTQ